MGLNNRLKIVYIPGGEGYGSSGAEVSMKIKKQGNNKYLFPVFMGKHAIKKPLWHHWLYWY
jgi:hypothetical protein